MYGSYYMKRYEKIEMGGVYWYSKAPHKVIYLSSERARLVPLNKAENFDLNSYGAYDVSVESTLAKVSDDEIATYLKTNVEVLDDGTVKKKRGRPKGSKNKGKRGDVTLAEVVELAKTFKKRGRPKGSKNKAK